MIANANDLRLKRRAQIMVAAAIQCGRLIRPSTCSNCGLAPFAGTVIRAHHNDYAKPLDVEWLCGSCHATRHFPSRSNRSRPVRAAENVPPHLVTAVEAGAMYDVSPRLVEVCMWRGLLRRHSVASTPRAFFARDELAIVFAKSRAAGRRPATPDSPE